MFIWQFGHNILLLGLFINLLQQSLILPPPPSHSSSHSSSLPPFYPHSLIIPSYLPPSYPSSLLLLTGSISLHTRLFRIYFTPSFSSSHWPASTSSSPLSLPCLIHVHDTFLLASTTSHHSFSPVFASSSPSSLPLPSPPPPPILVPPLPPIWKLVDLDNKWLNV